MNVKHQLILALPSAVYNTALYHFNKNTKEKTRKKWSGSSLNLHRRSFKSTWGSLAYHSDAFMSICFELMYAIYKKINLLKMYIKITSWWQEVGMCHRKLSSTSRLPECSGRSSSRSGSVLGVSMDSVSSSELKELLKWEREPLTSHTHTHTNTKLWSLNLQGVLWIIWKYFRK